MFSCPHACRPEPGCRLGGNLGPPVLAPECAHCPKDAPPRHQGKCLHDDEVDIFDSPSTRSTKLMGTSTMAARPLGLIGHLDLEPVALGSDPSSSMRRSTDEA